MSWPVSSYPNDCCPEPYRFWVQSSAGREKYFVDLTSYLGNGKCTCKDFAVRGEPDISRLPSWKYRCKHIWMALAHVGHANVQAFIKKYGQTMDT